MDSPKTPAGIIGETAVIVRPIWRKSKAQKDYSSPKILAPLVVFARTCQSPPNDPAPADTPIMIEEPSEQVPFDTKTFVAALRAHDAPPAHRTGVEGMSVAEVRDYIDIDGDVELLESFGARMREARIFRRMTQPEIAKLLGVSRQTISNWETERVPPEKLSLTGIRKLAKHFGVRYGWLRDAKGPMLDGDPAPPASISRAVAAAAARQGVALSAQGAETPLRGKLRGILKRLRPMVREMEDSDVTGQQSDALKLLRSVVRDLEDIADE